MDTQLSVDEQTEVAGPAQGSSNSRLGDRAAKTLNIPPMAENISTPSPFDGPDGAEHSAQFVAPVFLEFERKLVSQWACANKPPIVYRECETLAAI